MKRLLICLLALTHTLISNEIYNYVKERPFDPLGDFDNQSQLEKLFREKEIKTVIELGTYAGASALFLGKKVGEGGKVFAIDAWLKSSPEKDPHLKDKRVNYIFPLFLSNVKHADLTEVIVPIRISTDEAAKILNIKADLIYVNADHISKRLFQNILNWYPHLIEGGIMCGDNWDWSSVRLGVQKIASILGKQIEVEGNFWRLQ